MIVHQAVVGHHNLVVQHLQGAVAAVTVRNVLVQHFDFYQISFLLMVVGSQSIYAGRTVVN